MINGVSKVKIYEGKNFAISINEAFNLFLTDEQKQNKEFLKKIKKDLVKCYILYAATPKDYFLFGFNNKNRTNKQRKLFITDTVKDSVLNRLEGWDKYIELSDKYAVYIKTKKYFGRNVMKLDNHICFDSFSKFIKCGRGIFIKPLFGSYGKDVCIFDSKLDSDIKELFEKLTINEKSSWILEEQIIQSQEMAQWNSSSVNTVRVLSFLNKGKFHVITPFFRTGRKGSIVDNAGSGGIISNVNANTGVVYTDGFDEDGKSYECHPDSGLNFKGWQIPLWKELIETVKNVHMIMSDHIYVGWDFALTDNGWVLIEGNWGQFLNQYVDKVGRKEEFLKYMKGKSFNKSTKNEYIDE
ncbi:MAG: hypothetical protein BHV81_07940 [Butyricimonas synergistica]|nr:MAG: hypothetical protein BHV81_07940 [Butyricimonas synergistica]